MDHTLGRCSNSLLLLFAFVSAWERDAVQQQDRGRQAHRLWPLQEDPARFWGNILTFSIVYYKVSQNKIYVIWSFKVDINIGSEPVL